jgi:Undecaprenyl-phosphate glucose phosphotransferase
MLKESATTPSRFSLPVISATTVAALLTIADSIAILASGYFTYDMQIVYSYNQNLYFTSVAFVWVSTIALFNYSNLYRFEAALKPLSKIDIVLIAIATAFLFLLATLYSLQFVDELSRKWVGTFALSCVLSILGFRFALHMALTKLKVISNAKRSVAIVGLGAINESLLKYIKGSGNQPFNVFGSYAPAAAITGNEAIAGHAGNIDLLLDHARARLIDDVFVALPWSQEAQITNVVNKLRELPVNVYLVNDMVGFAYDLRPPPSHFSALPVVQVLGKPMSGWDAFFKTIEDYVLGIPLLILMSPILLTIAILIKLDSRGPVLFKQKRLGFNNQVFEIYKFRSMRTENCDKEKIVQAGRDDPRVTRLGRFLRRSSLDELPQIFNVLNGTMSIVGPRPHEVNQNYEFSERAEGYFARHRVKPGITGLAQVRGFRGETDTQEKLAGRVRNDIYYAENWSLSLDLWILYRTAIVCVLGTNAY